MNIFRRVNIITGYTSETSNLLNKHFQGQTPTIVGGLFLYTCSSHCAEFLQYNRLLICVTVNVVIQKLGREPRELLISQKN